MLRPTHAEGELEDVDIDPFHVRENVSKLEDKTKEI